MKIYLRGRGRKKPKRPRPAYSLSMTVYSPFNYNPLPQFGHPHSFTSSSVEAITLSTAVPTDA